MENHPDITAEAIYEERKKTYHMLLTIIDMLDEESNLQTPVLQVCKDLLTQVQQRYLISSDIWHECNTKKTVRRKGQTMNKRNSIITLTRMDFLKNVRRTLITDYKNKIMLCNKLKNDINDLDIRQEDAISFIEFLAALQLEHGIDMYANQKDRLILDSVKNIEAVGLKEFLGDITRISSSPYSYGILSIHPYQYLKPLFSKINDEKSLLSFCKRYADWLLEEYGENYGYEEEIYRNEGLLADYSINEDYVYFHYIIDCKYDAYNQTYDDAMSLLEYASDKLETYLMRELIYKWQANYKKEVH